jgi:hypothetical protein
MLTPLIYPPDSACASQLCIENAADRAFLCGDGLRLEPPPKCDLLGLQPHPQCITASFNAWIPSARSANDWALPPAEQCGAVYASWFETLSRSICLPADSNTLRSRADASVVQAAESCDRNLASRYVLWRSKRAHASMVCRARAVKA